MDHYYIIEMTKLQPIDGSRNMKTLGEALKVYKEESIKNYKNAVDNMNELLPTDVEQARFWARRAKNYAQENFKIVSAIEYRELQKIFYAHQPAEMIDEYKFDEMLEVLPPLKWTNNGDVEYFFMSEFETGDYTHQYCRIRTDGVNRYYKKLVDFTNPSTWHVR